MIEKIKRLQNIWRFQSFSWTSDEMTFKRNTFIFGKNTKWKSTITSIFRSLWDWNSDLLVWRKTFWETWPQIVNIKDPTWDITFTAWAWNRNLKIKIFDNQYITENVYSDDILDEEKQEKIATVILWYEWRRLESVYDNAKTALDENTKRKTAITSEYGKTFDKTVLTFDQFKALEGTENTKDLLDTNNIQLRSFESAGLILEKIAQLGLLINKRDAIDISKLRPVLEVNQTRIAEHIRNCTNNNPEVTETLEKWFNIRKVSSDIRQSCPLCSQELWGEAQALFSAYWILFWETYQTLSWDVARAIDFLKKWNIVSELSFAQGELNQLGVQDDFISKVRNLDENLNLFLEELEKKKSNLNFTINEASWILVSSRLEEISSVLEAIKAKYSDSSSVTIIQQLKNQNRLLTIKMQRLSSYWAWLCDEYKALEINFTDTLKPAEETAFNNRKIHSESMFSQYEASINGVLEKLWAGYKLVEFKVPQNRREALKLFSVQFNDTVVKIELLWSESTPHFKNTLSDSDKRMLAFAFFIADIQQTADLNEYIVVLDDPMSSFDEERKLTTVKVLKNDLKNWTHEPVQLFVLTHESNFYKQLNDIFAADKIFFRIEYIAADKTSVIKVCDIEEDFLKSQHCKILERMDNFVKEEIPEFDLTEVRMRLEYIIGRKYYLVIEDRAILNNWWLVNWYLSRTETPESIKEKINESFVHRVHHDQLRNFSQENLSDGDKRSIIKTLLEIIPEL